MDRRLKRVLSARVRLFVAAAAVTGLSTVNAALAASKTFIGTASHDWTNDTNWSPVGVPVATDDVAINAGKTADLSNTDAAINNLTLAGGTLTGTGTLTVNGTLTWSGGTMSGSGKTVAGGGLALNGSGTKTLNRTLSNTGAATWTDTGNITIGTGGVLSNEPGASFTVLAALR
jgi:hypothetical protein